MRRFEMAKTISKAALCMDDLSSNTCVITTEKLQEAKSHLENLHNIIEELAGERANEIYDMGACDEQ